LLLKWLGAAEKISVENPRLWKILLRHVMKGLLNGIRQTPKDKRFVPSIEATAENNEASNVSYIR
jgi:hypothetical protein